MAAVFGGHPVQMHHALRLQQEAVLRWTRYLSMIAALEAQRLIHFVQSHRAALEKAIREIEIKGWSSFILKTNCGQAGSERRWNSTVKQSEEREKRERNRLIFSYYSVTSL